MAGNYDKYGNYDFSMFEPKPVSFDHNAARKIATLPGVGERAAAHIGERGDLDIASLLMFLEVLGPQHIKESVIKRA